MSAVGLPLVSWGGAYILNGMRLCLLVPREALEEQKQQRSLWVGTWHFFVTSDDARRSLRY